MGIQVFRENFQTIEEEVEEDSPNDGFISLILEVDTLSKSNQVGDHSK